MKLRRRLCLLEGLLLAILAFLTTAPLAFAQEVAPQQALIDTAAIKAIAAAMAFGMAALGAGWAISRAGAAGMAAASERPEIRTTAIIITALGEALAIYGIVIALLLLG